MYISYSKIKKVCPFCKRKIKEIDYKDVETISRFINETAKIRPKSRTGVCSLHQRKLVKAIKRARFLALLPYTTH